MEMTGVQEIGDELSGERLDIAPERCWGGNTWMMAAGEDESEEHERWTFERGSAARVMERVGGESERASVL